MSDPRGREFRQKWLLSELSDLDQRVTELRWVVDDLGEVLLIEPTPVNNRQWIRARLNLADAIRERRKNESELRKIGRVPPTETQG